MTFKPTNTDQPIDCIAKVSDLTQWKQLANVQTNAVIEDVNTNTWIVAARTNVDTFATLHNLPFVMSIRMGCIS